MLRVAGRGELHQSATRSSLSSLWPACSLRCCAARAAQAACMVAYRSLSCNPSGTRLCRICANLAKTTPTDSRVRALLHFFSRAYDAAPRPCRVASYAHGLFASLVEASACPSFSATLSCCGRRTCQRQRPCDGSRKVVLGAGEPPRRAALMRVVPRPRGGHTSREMMPRQP